MKMPTEQEVTAARFQLQSVDPIAHPLGGSDHWYRYVISQGSNRENAITGERGGTLIEVNAQLHEMVERLNERFGKISSKKK